MSELSTPGSPTTKPAAESETKERRGFHLGLCWGGVFSFCGLLALLTLQHLGLIDLETCGRTVIAFAHGREGYRKQVEVGMTRAEVERRLPRRSNQTQSFTTVCVLRKPGTTGPLGPGLDYPTPFDRVEYPEYGFDVIYHGKIDELHDEWKVVAVEDRK